MASPGILPGNQRTKVVKAGTTTSYIKQFHRHFSDRRTIQDTLVTSHEVLYMIHSDL